MDHVKSENLPSIEEKWSVSGDILGQTRTVKTSKRPHLKVGHRFENEIHVHFLRM